MSESTKPEIEYSMRDALKLLVLEAKKSELANFTWLIGTTQAGKTYILRSLIGELEGENKLKYITMENFINEFTYEFRMGNASSYLQTYKGLRYLLIDDFETVAGLEASADAFADMLDIASRGETKIIISSSVRPENLNLSSKLREKAMFGDMIRLKTPLEDLAINKDNRLQISILTKMANTDYDLNYAPLYLYCESESVRTEALQALKEQCKRTNIKGTFLQFSMKDFEDELISAEKSKNNTMKMKTFREKYREVEWLIVNDFEEISGLEATTEEFLNTFNDLQTKGGHIVITSKLPIEEIDVPERLKAKIQNGLILEMN